MKQWTATDLRRTIETLFERPGAKLGEEAESACVAFRELLSRGEVRAAEPGANGWVVHPWVRKGILLGFRLGRMQDSSATKKLWFYEKRTLLPRKPEIEDRVVRGGTSIREGAYVARGVVCMPPMFINTGAYVDEYTMIDAHAIVGSCAQIGKHVHVSAGAQIGGAIEPAGAFPVIIEDRVLVGGNSGVYEGTIVKREAILAPGTILTGSTSVYDLVNETVIRAAPGEPLVIPRGAVVVPGARPAPGPFASREGISVYTPLIVKYRASNADAEATLESALRS